jgi:hypothetical protein
MWGIWVFIRGEYHHVVTLRVKKDARDDKSTTQSIEVSASCAKTMTTMMAVMVVATARLGGY